MKTSIVFIALILLIGALAAEFSDDYLIGCHSKMRIEHRDFNNALGDLVRTAGYNAAIAGAVYDPDNSLVTDMMNLIRDDSLDVILDDYIFYNQPPGEWYGVNALSSGVYFRFEAEYASADTVKPEDRLDDNYFYKSSEDRIGEVKYNNLYSWDYSWSVNAPDSGFAYSDLQFRWADAWGICPYIGPEFRFLGNYTNGMDIPALNNLNVSYVFNCTGLDTLDADAALARFQLTSHVANGSLILRHRIGSGALHYETVITKEDYLALPELDQTTHRRILTLTIPFSSFYGSNPDSSDDDAIKGNGWYLQLVNLNPLMYWFGNGNLLLDYIEFHDDIFDNYTNNPGKLALLRTFNAQTNLSHHYTQDEAKAGNFEAYKLVKNHLADQGIKVFTATDSHHEEISKQPGERYRNETAFIDYCHPNIFMMDKYPFHNSEEEWNQDSQNWKFVQDYLNNLCKEYEYYKVYADTTENQFHFFCATQTFGEFDWDSSGGGSWYYSLPPDKMAKCLQLLPLCYQADGILSFRFDSDQKLQDSHSNGKYIYGLVNHGYYDTDWEVTPQYYAVKEANRKIALYGRLIKDLFWESSYTIGTEPDNQHSIGDKFSSVYVEEESGNRYSGYVQCGAYDVATGYPSFMLVNRRTNYYNPCDPSKYPTPKYLIPPLYNSYFIDAPSQTVLFFPSAGAITPGGRQLALFDPADSTLCKTVNDTIKVNIDPGDGRLMRTCWTLPEEVTTITYVDNMLVVEGNVTIQTGARVELAENMYTLIKPGSTIHVASGAVLHIKGEVAMGDSVVISVDPGGRLRFSDSVCKWGKEGLLDVSGGCLFVRNSELRSKSPSVLWKGLNVCLADSVILYDSSFYNARYNQVQNSNLKVVNCRFEVQPQCYGLALCNDDNGYTTQLVGTAANMGFFGASATNSFGLVLGQMKNPVILNQLLFQQLKYGILKTANSSIRDTISNCSFSNCDTGIHLISDGYDGIIDTCSFIYDGVGIKLVAAIPEIANCVFNHCEMGILTEYSVFKLGLNRSIHNCSFGYNATGIESRCSNQRLEANYLTHNDNGLVNHAGSNHDLSFSANNVLQNDFHNVIFSDTAPYMSTLQLLDGHNDFYDLNPDYPDTLSSDFCFDRHYYNFPSPCNFTIKADRNWFQQMQVRVNRPEYQDYVYVSAYDPEPNMPAPPDDQERFCQAQLLEAQGEYNQALLLYKAILDDQLESEEMLYSNAADAVYRLSIQLSDQVWQAVNYFSAKLIQYEIDNPYLCALLKDYLSKSYIAGEDYQSAIDLIQLRIDNPVSEIDSLRAVMDLEIVLQLSTFNESKKPITTRYTQYRYPSQAVFSQRHDVHWALLYSLLENKAVNSIISTKALITSNYPNPFNPSTTINYYLPQTTNLKLSVYNIRGQKVRTLFSGRLPKGSHQALWNGKDANNRSVSSGIYFIRLEAEGISSTRKVMLMK